MFDLELSIGHCDYIQRPSDFALCLEGFFIKALGLWLSMTWCLTSNAQKITVTYVSLSSSYAFCLLTFWCMYMIARNNDSVWPDVWLWTLFRSRLPVFHGPHIVLNLGDQLLNDHGSWDNESVWLTVEHNELYYVVQLFSILSWGQFDVRTWCLGIMTSVAGCLTSNWR